MDHVQTTSHLLMIRPVNFTFNKETATNNAFQSIADEGAQNLALKEFDDFVDLLRQHEIDVTVVDDTVEPYTPDSIFPNNWISFHHDGSIVLYPMYAPNRRQERKAHVLSAIKEHFLVDQQIDLTSYEKDGIFLEGTGSMILDRENKIAYACLSERTHIDVLNDFCSKFGFTPHTFVAVDSNGYPIYHTNVMMCVANQYVVICLDSIADHNERQATIQQIESSGKEIIPISFAQMNHFAGNMLQVNNPVGNEFLVMSSQAYRAMTPAQISALEKHNPILHSSLDTIERNGGGSARCMMAEVFLSVR